MVGFVLVALAVSALAATATAQTLASRSELSSTRQRVDDSWAKLRPILGARYLALREATRVARGRLAGSRMVLDDIDRAVAQWPGTARAATETQVAAAADLEGLAARLAATVVATPRLRGASEVTAAMSRLAATDIAAARLAFNSAVRTYEQARGGFPRRMVAGALGYEERRMLEVPA